MEAGEHIEEVKFRPFQPEDIDACTRLAWDAWAADPDEPDEGVDPRVMTGYVRSFLARSNTNEIAYDSHGIVGFLFGRIGRVRTSSLIGEFSMIPHFMFQRYGAPASPIILAHFFLTEFKVMVNDPKSDAEINLFIVDSRHRGRGLGTMLMRRFIESAKKAGCKLLTLYTDDQLSNWKYYEKQGFTVVATFHDSLTSYFTERSAKGIVYAMKLG